MRTATNRREGMALLLALVLIVIVSTLIAGAFVAATQEYRVGRNGLIQERALTAAEFGQNRVLANWNTAAMSSKKNGDTLKYVDAVGNGATAVTTVTKLNPTTYWVVSEGQATQGQHVARRRVNSILRINVPWLKMPGTLTTNSQTLVEGAGAVKNNDANPTNWNDCPPPGSTVAGVANDDGNISSSGTCTGYSCITGEPKTKTTADAADTLFGGLPYDSLKARASKTFVAGSGGLQLSQIQPSYNPDGSCNVADNKNWGDMNRNLLLPGKCETYLPTVHFSGTGPVTLSGSSGQGVLLVDGPLNIQGQFTWVGAIIARGPIQITGVGNKLVGGAISLDQSCVAGGKQKYCNYLAGSSDIQFSRCAITAAFAAQAYPVLAKQRAWADMF